MGKINTSMKGKTVVKKNAIKRGKGALKGALTAMIKSTGGRNDLKFSDAPKAATVTHIRVEQARHKGRPLNWLLDCHQEVARYS